MNIDLGNSGNYEDLPPIFTCQGSPYLSPFLGSLSPEQHGSHEDIDDFKLEQEPFKSDGAQFQYQNLLIGEDLLLDHREQSSEAVIPIEKIQIKKEQKAEIQTPTYLAKPHASKVYSMIDFLVHNSDLPQETLKIQERQMCHGQQKLEIIFEILLNKFKKLRKTKQQMIKYCMRKAFKFISDLQKPSKKISNIKNQKPLPYLEMPFRKNSSEKTMNTQYLKQVFSQGQFLEGYHQFLKQISSVIQEDNASKIKYLSDMIQKMIDKNQVENVQKIKRLPWSQTILNKTEELAIGLLQFAQNSGIDSPKTQDFRKKSANREEPSNFDIQLSL